MKAKLLKYRTEVIVSLLMFLFFSPLILFPDKAQILKMDNLDGNIAMFKYMADNSINFMPYNENVHGIMGEMSRLFYPTGWSFMRLLFMIMPDYPAYVVHFIFQHVVGFFSMLILLRTIFEKKDHTLLALVSAAFALLPFFPSGELTVAGLPLLLAAFIRIFRRESQVWSWLVIGLFPYFSALSFGNLFTFPLIFLFFLVGLWLNWWKWSIRSMVPFLLILISTLHVEWPLIRLILDGVETNRNDSMAFQKILNVRGLIGVSMLLFVKGHFHHHSLHLPILCAVVVLFIFFAFNLKRSQFSVMHDKMAVMQGAWIIALIAGIAIVQTFLQNAAFIPIKLNYRFSAFFPVLWYLLLGLLVIKLLNKKVAMLLVSFQIIWNMLLLNPWKTEIVENPMAYTYFPVLHKGDYWHEPYDKFYQKDDFDELKIKLPDLDQQLVLCFGFHPAVAQYNHVNTFDAYLNIYPRAKWELMKQINTAERDRAGVRKFSTNRCYIYSYEWEKNKRLSSLPLWNFDAINKAGVKYMITKGVDLPGMKKVASVSDLQVYAITP